jgi:recombination directionality factor gp3-like protein
MSPTPLIELQRRLAEAGRIRMGEKTEKGAPKRLDTWRITSPTKELVEQAAGLYGGEPKPWDSPTGKQWEVVTTTAELPVLVMPGYSFRQGYEYRTSPTLVERRCDGVEQDDGTPCACNAEGFEGDECALISRLTVALPELTTMLGWRLETKGDNAARELLASMDLVQGISGGRPFVPAKLRIVERRGNVNGQAVRYVVPVIDVQVRYSEVLGGELVSRERAALPAGYIPLERPSNGATLADGLREAETQTLTKPPRVPLPEDDDILDESVATPSAADTSEAASIPSPASDVSHQATDAPDVASAPSPPKTITRAQRARLFAIGREYGVDKDHIRTLLRELTGSESTAELSVEHYESLVQLIQSRDPVNA